MPDDDNLQRQTLNQPEQQQPSIGGALTAALAALTSGLVLRVQELIALADEFGDVTIPVSSTCIAELRYNMQTHNLGVTFVDGAEYDYSDIPVYSALEFINASSKGAFFNERVRGKWGPWPIGSAKYKRAL